MSFSLSNFLEQKGLFIDRTIIDVLEKKLATERKAFLLRGPAGTGKTTLASLIAEYLKAELIFYQCSYGTSEDDLLYKYIPAENSRSGLKITLGPVPLALKKSQSKPVVLVIDEFDKTRPSADALLLDVLQNFRVSLYLDEKETIVQGNPNNLVVFLTSNDMREFSEPLLRRLAIIELRPLPTSEVLKLLRAKFDDRIAVLLAQIYDDTIKAGLRKPATVQELYELGELLQSGVNANIEDLLRMFIIKYNDDWAKFRYYVARREPYQFVKANDSNPNNEDKLESAYIAKEQVEVKEEEKKEEKEEEGNAKKIIESLSRIIVKKVERKIEKEDVQEIKDSIETTAKIVDNDFAQYTTIIQNLKLEPADSPDILGKFRVVLDEGKMTIVAKDPLSVGDIIRMLASNINGEYYFEHETPVVMSKLFDEVIKRATRIKYYSNNLIYLEIFGKNTESMLKLMIELQRVNSEVYNAKFKGYVKFNTSETSVVYDIKNVIDSIDYQWNKFKEYIGGFAKKIIDAIKKKDEKTLRRIVSELETIYKNVHMSEDMSVDEWIYLSNEDNIDELYEFTKSVINSSVVTVKLVKTDVKKIDVIADERGVVIQFKKIEEEEQ